MQTPEQAASEAIDKAEQLAFDDWKAELKADRAAFHCRLGVTQWDAFSAGFAAALEIARLAFAVEQAHREHSSGIERSTH